jgi:hypothetical protein
MNVPASSSPTDRKTRGEILAIVGGGLLVLGALLAWVKASHPTAGGVASLGGMAGEDGAIFFVGGLVIAALGLRAHSGHSSTAFPALLIVGGLAAAGGAFVEYRDVTQATEAVGGNLTYGVGVGVWFLFAGALLSVVAGIVLWGQMKPKPVQAAATGARATWSVLGGARSRGSWRPAPRRDQRRQRQHRPLVVPQRV